MVVVLWVVVLVDQFGFDGDWFGYVVQGQVVGDVGVVVVGFYFGGFEGSGWVFVDVEEIIVVQVFVMFGMVGVYVVGVDGYFDFVG